MKFNVNYSEGEGHSTLYNSIVFEVADLETCKNAVAQWQFNEKRLKGRNIKILSINPDDISDETVILSYTINELMEMRDDLIRHPNRKRKFTIAQINAESDRRRDLYRSIGDRYAEARYP
jgi:hypothetical protein